MPSPPGLGSAIPVGGRSRRSTHRTRRQARIACPALLYAIWRIVMALVIAPSISYTAEMLSADVIGLRQRASNWCLVGLIAGGILLSPIFGFLMALVVDILIGLLNDGGVLTLVVASVIGGFLFRAMLPRPVG